MLLRMVPCLLVMGTIFFLSDTPGDRINQLLPAQTSDKFCHFVAYGVLAASFLFAFSPLYRWKYPVRTMIFVVILSFLYGCLDEFHQSFIVLRSPDGADIVADISGALCCCLLWRCFVWKKE